MSDDTFALLTEIPIAVWALRYPILAVTALAWVAVIADRRARRADR